MATINARKLETRALIDAQEFDVLFSPEAAARMNALTGWNFPLYKRVINTNFPYDTRCVAHSDDGQQWAVWSWNKAIAQRNNLHEALRKAVQTQLAAYSATANNKCAQCGSGSYLSVDHKTVPFIQLVAHLLRMFPNAHEALANDSDGSGWYLKDKELERVWQDLHKQHADYQILCRSCNSKKGASHGNA